MFPYDFEKRLADTRTNIESFSNERSMLGWFVAKFQKLDPDIIIGLVKKNIRKYLIGSGC